MWSVRYKTVYSREGDKPVHCRVCRNECLKVHITERKMVYILRIIPIPGRQESFEICSGCKARVRIHANPELIDS